MDNNNLLIALNYSSKSGKFKWCTNGLILAGDVSIRRSISRRKLTWRVGENVGDKTSGEHGVKSTILEHQFTVILIEGLPAGGNACDVHTRVPALHAACAHIVREHRLRVAFPLRLFARLAQLPSFNF